MRTILFLCTGNYYHSRFAEQYFNNRSRQIGLDWLALSRGLAMACGINDAGAISPLAVQAMEKYGIFIPDPVRRPRSVCCDELLAADLIVAIGESEHRMLMRQRFPSWEHRVHYWQIDDLDGGQSSGATSMLAVQIDCLINELTAQTRRAIIRRRPVDQAIEDVAAPASMMSAQHVHASANLASHHLSF